MSHTKFGHAIRHGRAWAGWRKYIPVGSRADVQTHTNMLLESKRAMGKHEGRMEKDSSSFSGECSDLVKVQTLAKMLESY